MFVARVFQLDAREPADRIGERLQPPPAADGQLRRVLRRWRAPAHRLLRRPTTTPGLRLDISPRVPDERTMSSLLI
jgi:hypothetical protein